MSVALQWILGLCCAGLLSGCAQAPAATATAPALPAQLLMDSSFAPPRRPVDPAEALALSPAMRSYLQHDIARQVRSLGPRAGLMQALQQRGALQLRYDASQTRSAAQAFEAREGNCLSLVLMTAALARELGLQVRFQTVSADAPWSRSAGLLVVSTHVNLTLGRRLLGEPGGYDQARELTVDFLPPDQIRGQRVQPLAEGTLIAMFLNNRAAEALAAQDLDQAYAWARAAVGQDPAFLSAYNTLAVIYLRHGQPAAAERALAHVLTREPGHILALANQVQALRSLGRTAEAERAAANLARLEPQAPYRDFNLGMAALQAGDPNAARALFLKELDRDPDNHEFHFALAQAEWQLGHPEATRQQLQAAHQASTQAATRSLYAAKLAWLQAQQPVR
jgi:Tfp pilus assembly protein PilF